MAGIMALPWACLGVFRPGRAVDVLERWLSLGYADVSSDDGQVCLDRRGRLTCWRLQPTALAQYRSRWVLYMRMIVLRLLASDVIVCNTAAKAWPGLD